jgi:DHA1 family bicyclomycin/chloramphenicol resistance-like MFS transporter
MEKSTAPPSSLLPVLTALTALGSISVSMYLPSLPSLVVALHATAASIKLSLSAFLMVFAFSQLAYGPLSDRFGRKPPIAAGLCIYIVGSLLCALSMNAAELVAARMIQALGAAAGPALGRAVVRDLYAADRLTSALAIIAAAVALSPMLGPVAGGYVEKSLGWRANFFILLGAGALLLAAVWFLLPETNRHLAADGLKLASIRRNYQILLVDSEYVAALLCGGLLTAGNFAWTAAAPFLFVRLFHFQPEQYGNLALVVGAGYVAGTLLSGGLSRRLTPPTLVYLGMSCTLLGSFALLVFSHLLQGYSAVVAAMVLFTAGMGIVLPMSAACALSLHPEIAGSAAGLLGSLQIFTGALGTLTAGLFSAASFTPTACLLVISSLAATAAAYVALRPFYGRIVPATVSHA